MSAPAFFGQPTHRFDLETVGPPTFPLEYSIERMYEHRSLVVPYRRHGDVAGEPGLPDPDAWKINPYKDKIETPIDERGLVKYDELISTLKQTLEPDYEFANELSLDHIYYDAEWYHSAFAPDCAPRFRELSVHKAIVPRVFENWKHLVMLPPDVPSEEVMELRIESWNVATKLFESICETEVWKRRAEKRAEQILRRPQTLSSRAGGVDTIGSEIIRETLDKHFRGVEQNLERLVRLPEEFRFADPNSPHMEIANRLYRLVGAEALYYVDQVAA